MRIRCDHVESLTFALPTLQCILNCAVVKTTQIAKEQLVGYWTNADFSIKAVYTKT